MITIMKLTVYKDQIMEFYLNNWLLATLFPIGRMNYSGHTAHALGIGLVMADNSCGTAVSAWH